jgi:hypothetical protein
MITHCPTYDGCVALEVSSVDASSPVAKRIKELVEDGLRHLAEPRVQPLKSEIEQILEEAAETTGGTPVDAATAEQAIRFAYLLPWSLPQPELAPDADGEISFDWIGPLGKMFSVSVDRTGRISYAGRFGHYSKIHGTEKLSEACPQEIIRGIRRAVS